MAKSSRTLWEALAWSLKEILQGLCWPRRLQPGGEGWGSAALWTGLIWSLAQLLSSKSLVFSSRILHFFMLIFCSLIPEFLTISLKTVQPLSAFYPSHLARFNSVLSHNLAISLQAWAKDVQLSCVRAQPWVRQLDPLGRGVEKGKPANVQILLCSSWELILLYWRGFAVLLVEPTQ